jgi:hypothetical protein
MYKRIGVNRKMKIKVKRILGMVVVYCLVNLLSGCVSDDSSQLGVWVGGEWYEVDSGIGKVYVGERVIVRVYGGRERGALIVGRK